MFRRTRPSPPAARSFASLAVAAALTAACNPFSVTQHDTATLEISAESQTDVRVITSDLFAVFFDEEGNLDFHLFNGDTTWISLNAPFKQDFDLRETGMFYARTAESEDPEAVINMRVLIDGREQFNMAGVLQGSGMQFYYVAH